MNAQLHEQLKTATQHWNKGPSILETLVTGDPTLDWLFS